MCVIQDGLYSDELFPLLSLQLFPCIILNSSLILNRKTICFVVGALSFSTFSSVNSKRYRLNWKQRHYGRRSPCPACPYVAPCTPTICTTPVPTLQYLERFQADWQHCDTIKEAMCTAAAPKCEFTLSQRCRLNGTQIPDLLQYYQNNPI